MKTYHKTTTRRSFYKEMHAKLDGRCMICGEQERLVIDHNHQTGELRGLLCYTHNSGLGMFQDNPEMLDKAAAYLREQGHEVPSQPITDVDKRYVSPDHQQTAIKLLNDPCFSSDRERARELSHLLHITEFAAQARMSRLRQRVRQHEAT